MHYKITINDRKDESFSHNFLMLGFYKLDQIKHTNPLQLRFSTLLDGDFLIQIKLC